MSRTFRAQNDAAGSEGCIRRDVCRAGSCKHGRWCCACFTAPGEVEDPGGGSDAALALGGLDALPQADDVALWV
jgi:hypothetical protein